MLYFSAQKVITKRMVHTIAGAVLDVNLNEIECYKKVRLPGSDIAEHDLQAAGATRGGPTSAGNTYGGGVAVFDVRERAG